MNPECPVTFHSAAVTSFSISPDGKRIVCGSEDTLVKIWDTDTGSEVRSFGSDAGVGRCACVAVFRACFASQLV